MCTFVLGATKLERSEENEEMARSKNEIIVEWLELGKRNRVNINPLHADCFIARVARVAKLTWPFIWRIRHTYVRYFYSFLLIGTAAKNWSQPAVMTYEYCEFACAFSKLFRTC